MSITPSQYTGLNAKAYDNSLSQKLSHELDLSGFKDEVRNVSLIFYTDNSLHEADNTMKLL